MQKSRQQKGVEVKKMDGHDADKQKERKKQSRRTCRRTLHARHKQGREIDIRKHTTTIGPSKKNTRTQTNAHLRAQTDTHARTETHIRARAHVQTRTRDVAKQPKNGSELAHAHRNRQTMRKARARGGEILKCYEE